MICKLVHDPNTSEVRNGLKWFRNVCIRCRREIYSPYHPSKWNGAVICKAELPEFALTDWREWFRFFGEVVSLPEAEKRCAFIRWRFAGSPIDQLPPGVPAPNLPPKNAGLTDAEVAELLPDEDPTLIGNRIAALTKALGIPPCGRCNARREWLNAAHDLIRRSLSRPGGG